MFIGLVELARLTPSGNPRVRQVQRETRTRVINEVPTMNHWINFDVNQPPSGGRVCDNVQFDASSKILLQVVVISVDLHPCKALRRLNLLTASVLSKTLPLALVWLHGVSSAKKARTSHWTTHEGGGHTSF